MTSKPYTNRQLAHMRSTSGLTIAAEYRNSFRYRLYSAGVILDFKTDYKTIAEIGDSLARDARRNAESAKDQNMLNTFTRLYWYYATMDDSQFDRLAQKVTSEANRAIMHHKPYCIMDSLGDFTADKNPRKRFNTHKQAMRHLAYLAYCERESFNLVQCFDGEKAVSHHSERITRVLLRNGRQLAIRDDRTLESAYSGS